MSIDIAIIICTEKGPLENMSRLLVSSLREFGGAMKDIPVYSYQPRKGWEVSQSTREFFKTNNVTLIDNILNEKYSDYPLANKILASSHAEQTLKNEILVFLDSDTLFMAEPGEFIIPENYDAVLRPVDSKNVGAENEDDPNWDYWLKLYALTGVDEYQYVTTSIDQKRILAYWNGGHLAVRREKNIFQKWEYNFDKVMKEGLEPNDGVFFLEQSIFAATVSAMKCKVKQFSHLYNYPIHMQSKIPDPGKKIKIISESVSVHYHRIFTEKHAKAILTPLIDPNDDKSRWLIENLVNLRLLEKGEILPDQTIPYSMPDKGTIFGNETQSYIMDKDGQIELLKSRIQQKNMRIKSLEKEIKHEKAKAHNIKQSLTWKAGRVILTPLIKFESLFKKYTPFFPVFRIKKEQKIEESTWPYLKSCFKSITIPQTPDENAGWKGYPAFKGKTPNVDFISCHSSVLSPGKCPHPPHEHREEEVLILLSGEVVLHLPERDISVKDKQVRLFPGQFAYYPAFYPHTLETIGEEPANYLMFKWYNEKALKKDTLGYMLIENLDPLSGYQFTKSFNAKLNLDGPTKYCRKFHSHTTYLLAHSGYEPHQDQHDVAIIILEGEVTTNHTKAKPFDVIFYPAGEWHDMYNADNKTCRYLVFEFHGYDKRK